MYHVIDDLTYRVNFSYASCSTASADDLLLAASTVKVLPLVAMILLLPLPSRVLGIWRVGGREPVFLLTSMWGASSQHVLDVLWFSLKRLC